MCYMPIIFQKANFYIQINGNLYRISLKIHIRHICKLSMWFIGLYIVLFSNLFIIFNPIKYKHYLHLMVFILVLILTIYIVNIMK